MRTFDGRLISIRVRVVDMGLPAKGVKEHAEKLRDEMDRRRLRYTGLIGHGTPRQVVQTFAIDKPKCTPCRTRAVSPISTVDVAEFSIGRFWREAAAHGHVRSYGVGSNRCTYSTQALNLSAGGSHCKVSRFFPKAFKSVAEFETFVSVAWFAAWVCGLGLLMPLTSSSTRLEIREGD